MNGQQVLKMLQGMSEEELKQTSFIYLNGFGDVNAIIDDVSREISDVTENLDFVHAREVGIHVSADDISEFQQKSIEAAFDDFQDGAFETYLGKFRSLIENKMKEKLRELGYKVLDD